MQKFTLLLCYLALCHFVSAQNLVLNPSFENINVTCSGFAGAGYTNIVNWDNPDPTDTCSTPDWFSTCLNSFFPTSAPNSWLGNQSPRTGDAYAGIILYDATTNAYREYLEGTLASPLVAGQTYCVSFYVSLADTVPYAVSNIGVYLSNTFTQFPVSHCVSTVPLPVTPQLQWTGAALTDDSAWVRLQWQYVATGGEQYFVIGNFNNNANTTVTNTSGTGWVNPFAYYFIDDVSISTGICCDATIISPGNLCTNGNSINLYANTSGGTWSGTGITNTTTGAFDPAAAGLGTHVVTYSLACGASDTLSITVGNCMEVCVDGNGNVNVSGGTGPYSWESSSVTQDCSACLIGCVFPPGCAVNTVAWQNFATGTSITPPATFPYRVTDNSGQTLVIDSATVIPPCGTLCTLSATYSVISVNCYEDKMGSITVTPMNGTAPYTYTWSSGQTTPTISALGIGTYTCIIYDADSCTSSITAAITSPPIMQLTGSSTPATGSNNGTATVNATGGVAPYTYSWQTTPVQYSQTISGLGTGTYVCIVHDANNCAKQVFVTVTEALGIMPEIIGIESLSLSPNPSDGNFELNIQLANVDDVSVGIYDVSGKMVHQNNQNHVTHYHHSFHLAQLSSGIYMVKIKTSKGELAEKIVIQ